MIIFRGALIKFNERNSPDKDGNAGEGAREGIGESLALGEEAEERALKGLNGK